MTTLTGFQLPEPLAPGTAEWWTKYSASKVAAIVGLSKWDTPRSIYDAMKGIVPLQPQTDVQGRGHEFEPLIRGWFQGMHPDWSVEETSTWQHSIREWQTADPDGIVTISTVVDGVEVVEIELLEIKTADDIHQWGDQVPMHYLVQAMWQMDVIGARRTHLAACGPFELFHRRPKVFVIDYDARDAAVLRERVLAFDQQLQAGVQPAADHSRDCDRLSVRYANTSIADDPGVDVPAEIAVPYLEAFAAEAAVALEKKRTGSVLLEYLGSSKKATFNGHTIASRVNSKGAPSIRATSGLAEKAPEILNPRKAAA